jgi:hypothetical protein
MSDLSNQQVPPITIRVIASENLEVEATLLQAVFDEGSPVTIMSKKSDRLMNTLPTTSFAYDLRQCSEITLCRTETNPNEAIFSRGENS